MDQYFVSVRYKILDKLTKVFEIFFGRKRYFKFYYRHDRKIDRERRILGYSIKMLKPLKIKMRDIKNE